MNKILNNEITGHLLKILVNLLGIILIIIFIIDLFGGKMGFIMNPVATLYISLLSIYASNKEFNRWKEKYKSKYSGELFVYVWTIIIFASILISLFSKGKFIIADSIITTYIAIITIFAITKQSKKLFEEENK